jgi:hypothetical protein
VLVGVCVLADARHLDRPRLLRYATLYSAVLILACFDLELLRLLPYSGAAPYDGFATHRTMVLAFAFRAVEALPQAALAISFLTLDAQMGVHSSSTFAAASLAMSLLTLLHRGCHRFVISIGMRQRLSMLLRDRSISNLLLTSRPGLLLTSKPALSKRGMSRASSMASHEATDCGLDELASGAPSHGKGAKKGAANGKGAASYGKGAAQLTSAEASDGSAVARSTLRGKTSLVRWASPSSLLDRQRSKPKETFPTPELVPVRGLVGAQL